MVEYFYFVRLKVQSNKEFKKSFICSKRRSDEFNNTSVFHGVGYWHNGIYDHNFSTEGKQEQEVWIPWDRIKYIESLIYKQR
jgi:hypothetical protein